MFVTDATIQEIACDMQTDFEIGSLHSQSTINQIARLALEQLADRNLPQRKSLAFVIAKNALMQWQETIHQTKKETSQ